MIPIASVEQAAYELMFKAGIDIPADYENAIRAMSASETGKLSCFVLETMLSNWNVASADRRPMCADTGVPRFYDKSGNEARVEGGFVALEQALRADPHLLAGFNVYRGRLTHNGLAPLGPIADARSLLGG